MTRKYNNKLFRRKSKSTKNKRSNTRKRSNTKSKRSNSRKRSNTKSKRSNYRKRSNSLKNKKSYSKKKIIRNKKGGSSAGSSAGSEGTPVNPLFGYATPKSMDEAPYAYLSHDGTDGEVQFHLADSSEYVALYEKMTAPSKGSAGNADYYAPVNFNNDYIAQ